MAWTYIQRTGALWRNGQFVAYGYSGHDKGVNNPDLQDVPMVGPIPKGTWQITTWIDDHPHLGPCVSHLIPSPDTNVFGRSGFFIHGDNAQMDHTGSDGCIVLSPDVRHAMRDSGDNELLVT